MTDKEALKICKLLTSTPTHMALLTEMHDNGPRYREDIIDSVLLRNEWDLPDVGSLGQGVMMSLRFMNDETLRSSFMKLVKYGLIKSEYIKNRHGRRTYSVNKELINEAMEKIKETIGVNE